jgi:hypothetical protein
MKLLQTQDRYGCGFAAIQLSWGKETYNILAASCPVENTSRFTKLLLHNYNLKLECEDYSKNFLASLTCLAFYIS